MITETLNETSGRYVVTVGKFTFVVEDYKDRSVTIHNNAGQMPQFVRESGPYTSHDVACDRAWHMAQRQSKA